MKCVSNIAIYFRTKRFVARRIVNKYDTEENFEICRVPVLG